MPRSGGTYSLPLAQVQVGTTISTTWANTTLADLATALTNSLAKDGQTSPTAALPMAGFTHTGVGDATARNHYAAAGQIQDAALLTIGSIAGTDTITGSLTPAITSFATGMRFQFVPANTSTGAVTLALNGLAAKAITKYGATALAAGDLVASSPADIVYDGTQFVLLNPATVRNTHLAAIAALSKTDGNVIVANGTTFVAEAGATARASLGLSIGSDVQAFDADLSAIAALAKTNGNFIVGNGSAWVAEAGATARASLGLTIGTNVQAHDADLDAIAALAKTNGNFIVGNGSTWVAESGATARASLGAAASSHNHSANNITSGTLAVARGGTNAGTASAARTNLGLGSIATRKLTVSTSAPSGGSDSDLWFVREA